MRPGPRYCRLGLEELSSCIKIEVSHSSNHITLCMDQNSIKIFEKWVKKCKKLGLSYAKMGDFEFSEVQKVEKAAKKGKLAQKEGKIEGLTHDPSAAMPQDSEMLFYSTPTFDSMRESRKDNTPR